VRIAIALAASALLLTACSGKSNAPNGWQPVPGASAAWSTGSGAQRQEYSVETSQFAGSLKDLASRVTIDELLRNRGAKLQGSLPFEVCPGAAGVATFTLPGSATLQEGFAVRNGSAVRTRYLRPAGTPVDPAVAPAMQNVLCTL
jgi:hypothetical protein